MPSRAVFYTLTPGHLQARGQFVCQLAQKLYRQGKTLLILCATPEEAQHLDHQLWHFSPESFVPHHQGAQAPHRQGVCISTSEPLQGAFDVLINLALAPPQHLHLYGQIVELVTTETPQLQASRQHYRFYQHQNIPLETHAVTVK